MIFKQLFRRHRKSVADEATEIVTELHRQMKTSFRLHGYTEAQAREMADIAFEGWLNYVREAM